MERHKCKLCFKGFSNGRALGGHMRSHLFNLPIPATTKLGEREETELKLSQLGKRSVLASCFPCSGEEGEIQLGRSLLMADPEFSVTVDDSSVVLQDRESETESSRNPTRKRSRRTRKPSCLPLVNRDQKPSQLSESWTEPEPVSSVSDATTEEGVAFCLMMLSRDRWNKTQKKNEPGESDAGGDDDVAFKCETCGRAFRSYQALGGHRASHKKNKSCGRKTEQENDSEMADKKIHKCPICSRVFSSGQALGGHKRSHGNLLIESNPSRKERKERIFDLNLPAPIDDDEDEDGVDMVTGR